MARVTEKAEDAEVAEPVEPVERPVVRPRWREPRILVPAVVAVVALSLGAGLAYAGRDDGGDVEPLPPLPTTTVDAGGIDVAAPEGWTAIPVPNLGFGIAVPPGWEATILADDVLASLERSSPAVPGFLDAAHAAAESGSVLYGAGADAEDRVTDLKVRAAPEAGVEDAAGLRDYATRLAADAGLQSPVTEVVEGAERPTVRTRFATRATSEGGTEVAVAGTETLVLGPRGVVWSVIVTSEVPEMRDDLAPRITDTLTFAE